MTSLRRVSRGPPPEEWSREAPSIAHGHRGDDDPHRSGERKGIGDEIRPGYAERVQNQQTRGNAHMHEHRHEKPFCWLRRVSSMG
jgi:hypothetical protein